MVRHAFTLIELLIVVAIIALLVSVLFPSIKSARERGIDARCLSNYRNAVASIVAYANGNRDCASPALIDRNGSWSDPLSGGWDIVPGRIAFSPGPRPEVWQCPVTGRPFVGNCKALGTNSNGEYWPWTTGLVPMSRWHHPSTLVVAYDVQPDLTPGRYAAADTANIGDISDERVISWYFDEPEVVFPATFDYLGPHSNGRFVVGFADGHAAIGAFLNESEAYFWNGPRWWTRSQPFLWTPFGG